MARPKKSAAAAGLPDDPMVEILSRLPVKELHRSKCVSKGWRDLIADPLHRKNLPQTLHGFFASYTEEETEGLGSSFINLLGGGSPPLVDPASFSSSIKKLKLLPGIHNLWLSGSCNGLLLFTHSTDDDLGELGYIVLNPATEQWAAVPSEQHPPAAHRRIRWKNHACLVYDPVVSSHRFHLLIFYEEARSLATVHSYSSATGVTVHSYSSATGVWRHGRIIDWAEQVRQLSGRHWNVLGPHSPQISGTTLFDGMLYLILNDGHYVAEVDVEGKTRRIIPAPSWSWVARPRPRRQVVDGCRVVFIGQSDGCLHCISEELWAGDDIPSSDDDYNSNLLSVWVLEDTQKWALKHTVSSLHLFGIKCYRAGFDYDVVAIHPDSSNLVFIVHYMEKEFISYGFGSKEVRLVVKTLTHCPLLFAPYVPCFLDFLPVVQHEEKPNIQLMEGR